MQLRPHHLLDIVNAFGHGREFEPSPYGHAVHTVAATVLSDVETEVKFVLAADDVCRPCKHLLPNGQCDDISHSASPPIPKQQRNDDLDGQLFRYLELAPGTVMTVREFLETVGGKLPGVETICVHRDETPNERLQGLIEGLRKLGISSHADRPSPDEQGQ